MFNKETLEKENEQFSSAILYVATAVYVSVCAMVFGALYAKLPSFVDAFLLYMKDYGTILAGIPVLVAVVVAKQQLDAMRRQHVATVKRSLRKEIEALNSVRKLTRLNANKTPEHFSDLSKKLNSIEATYKEFDKSFEEKTDAVLPKLITWKAKRIREKILSFNQSPNGTTMSNDDINKRFDDINSLISQLEHDLEEFDKSLTQYWS